MFIFVTDTDENEKTISQSSALGEVEIGQYKNTERIRNMKMRREQTNNLMARF